MPLQEQLVVRIGQPVEEFLRQPAAKAIAVSLPADGSGYWATERPFRVRVAIFNEFIEIENVQGLGMFVSSSPNSINGTTDAISRIRTFDAPILNGKVSRQQYDSVSTYCKELKLRFGSQVQAADISAILEDKSDWHDTYEFNACAFTGSGGTISVGLRRASDQGDFFVRLHVGETEKA